MELQPSLRFLLALPFLLMILGLSLPLSALVLLALAAGLMAAMTDRFVVRFRSISEARMLRQARSRRTWIAGLAFIFLPLLLTLTITPSLSSEDALPNVAGLKAFSAQTKFMSREGYLIYIARRDYGMELSRGDARRIVNRQKKGGTAYARVADPSPRYVRQNNGYDPIRAKYGAAAEEYRRRTYHGNNDARDTIPHQRKVVTPVRSKFSKRYDRVLKASHPTADFQRVRGYQERPSVQRVHRVVRVETERPLEYDKLYRQRAWCDSCRRFHTDGHAHQLSNQTVRHVMEEEIVMARPRAIMPVPAARYTARPARAAYPRRVVVLPFAVRDNHDRPQGRVEEEFIRQLTAQGYEVVPLPVDYYSNNGGYPSTARYRAIADRTGAEFVVDGRVMKYHDYKRVSLGGLILGGLVSGVHGYGDVALETAVYRRSMDEVLTDRVAERTKKQILGILGGTGDLLGLSLERAVRRVSALL